MSRLIRGAAAGTVATGLMSAVMMGAKRTGLMGGMPPEKVTAKLLDRFGVRRSRTEQDILAAVSHFGFGAVAGAAFGVVAPRPLLARLPLGLAYGAGIWGVSYMGWVPALGIMPSAPHDRRDRQVSMLAAHLVFGAALGLLVGRRRKKRPAEAGADAGMQDTRTALGSDMRTVRSG